MVKSEWKSSYDNFERAFFLFKAIIDPYKVKEFHVDELSTKEVTEFIPYLKGITQIISRKYFTFHAFKHDSIFEMISIHCQNLERIKLYKRFSYHSLHKVLTNCQKLREIYLLSECDDLLVCLTNHPNVHQIEKLVYEDILYIEHLEDSKRAALLKFIKKSGNSLKSLHFINCHFICDEILDTVAQHCPNFNSFSISMDTVKNIPTDFSVSSFMNLAKNCKDFPKKLKFNYGGYNLQGSREDVEQFTKFCFKRLKKLEINIENDSLVENLFNLDHCDTTRLKKIFIMCNTSHDLDKFTLDIPKFKILENLRFCLRSFISDNDPKDKTLEIHSDSLRKIQISSQRFVKEIRYYCPNLIVKKNLINTKFKIPSKFENLHWQYKNIGKLIEKKDKYPSKKVSIMDTKISSLNDIVNFEHLSNTFKKISHLDIEIDSTLLETLEPQKIFNGLKNILVATKNDTPYLKALERTPFLFPNLRRVSLTKANRYIFDQEHCDLFFKLPFRELNLNGNYPKEFLDLHIENPHIHFISLWRNYPLKSATIKCKNLEFLEFSETSSHNENEDYPLLEELIEQISDPQYSSRLQNIYLGYQDEKPLGQKRSLLLYKGTLPSIKNLILEYFSNVVKFKIENHSLSKLSAGFNNLYKCTINSHSLTELDLSFNCNIRYLYIYEAYSLTYVNLKNCNFKQIYFEAPKFTSFKINFFAKENDLAASLSHCKEMINLVLESVSITNKFVLSLPKILPSLKFILHSSISSNVSLFSLSLVRSQFQKINENQETFYLSSEYGEIEKFNSESFSKKLKMNVCEKWKNNLKWKYFSSWKNLKDKAKKIYPNKLEELVFEKK